MEKIMPCPIDLTEITTRAMSAAGGFLGGTSLLAYMRPSSVKEALVRIGVSTVAASMTAPIVVEKFVSNDPSVEILAGVAFCIGFIAWNVLGAIAMFFENRQGKDALQIIKEVKDGTPTVD